MTELKLNDYVGFVGRSGVLLGTLISRNSNGVCIVDVQIANAKNTIEVPGELLSPYSVNTPDLHKRAMKAVRANWCARGGDGRTCIFCKAATRHDSDKFIHEPGCIVEDVTMHDDMVKK